MIFAKCQLTFKYNMKQSIIFVQFVLFYFLSCSSQTVFPTETYLTEFLKIPVDVPFIIKTDFAVQDTLTYSELLIAIDTIKPENKIIKQGVIGESGVIFMDEDPYSVKNYIGETYKDPRMRFVVYFQNEIFYIDLNPDENKIQSVSVNLEINGLAEYLLISYNSDNLPFIYNIQKTKATQNWDNTSYELMEGKRIDFCKNPNETKIQYAAEYALSKELSNFGFRLIAYLKNKKCKGTDFLKAGHFFNETHIKKLNLAVDSLIARYASMVQEGESITNFNDMVNSDLIIRFDYTNHPTDGHLYSVSGPMIMNKSSEKRNWNHEWLCIILNQRIGTFFSAYQTPTKYCIPIKYRKLFYVYYSKGKVIRIAE